MKLIALTKGQFAKVDNSDFDWLSAWKWRASWDATTRSFYAMRAGPRPERKTILMHRAVNSTSAGLKTDHIDGDTLNNQRLNLRNATNSQNLANRGPQRNNKLSLKGVRQTRTGRYRAQITIEGKQVYLGTRDTPEAAHALYADAANAAFGAYARSSGRGLADAAGTK